MIVVFPPAASCIFTCFNTLHLPRKMTQSHQQFDGKLNATLCKQFTKCQQITAISSAQIQSIIRLKVASTPYLPPPLGDFDICLDTPSKNAATLGAVRGNATYA